VIIDYNSLLPLGMAGACRQCCLSLRSSVTKHYEYDILNIRIRLSSPRGKGIKRSTLGIDQEVKGQSHTRTRPKNKTDLDAYRRHRSWPFNSVEFIL